MATRKSTPPNRPVGRRPLDTIDSLRPSSLPPELGSLDMSWDDDPRSVGAIDLLQNADLDLDVDAGERTTAVPEIPIERLVQETMAEADARERSENTQQGSEWNHRPDEPAPRDASNRHLGSTQPAPSRQSSLRAEQYDSTADHGGAISATEQPPCLPLAPSSPSQQSASNPAIARSRGSLGSISSRPPSAPEQRFSAPPTLRRSDADEMRNQMKDRYATGDFSGALALAENLVEADAGDLDAQRFATSCRDILTQMLTSRLGSFEQVVEVLLTPEELRWLTLDHRAGFFLSLVDGVLTIEELLDISGMARLESLRILATLIEQRVLRLAPH